MARYSFHVSCEELYDEVCIDVFVAGMLDVSCPLVSAWRQERGIATPVIIVRKTIRIRMEMLGPLSCSRPPLYCALDYPRSYYWSSQ